MGKLGDLLSTCQLSIELTCIESIEYTYTMYDKPGNVWICKMVTVKRRLAIDLHEIAIGNMVLLLYLPCLAY